MQLGFVHESKYCTGCRACQIACKDLHDLEVGQRWRRVYTVQGGGFAKDGQGDGYVQNVFAYNLSVSCNHCTDPRCVKNCPSGAMTKRTEDGVVFVNQDICIGCGMCKWSCPYDAPQMNEELGRMGKCDFCKDLQAEGKNPVCVDACPLRLIHFGDIEELRKQYGGSAAVASMPEASITQPNLVIVAHKDAM